MAQSEYSQLNYDNSQFFIPNYPLPTISHFIPIPNLFLDNWSIKAQRRRTTGTGRMKHLKLVQRRFKNGFREGVQAKSKKTSAAAPVPASS